MDDDRARHDGILDDAAAEFLTALRSELTRPLPEELTERHLAMIAAERRSSGDRPVRRAWVASTAAVWFAAAAAVIIVSGVGAASSGLLPSSTQALVHNALRTVGVDVSGFRSERPAATAPSFEEAIDPTAPGPQGAPVRPQDDAEGDVDQPAGPPTSTTPSTGDGPGQPAEPGDAPSDAVDDRPERDEPVDDDERPGPREGEPTDHAAPLVWRGELCDGTEVGVEYLVTDRSVDVLEVIGASADVESTGRKAVIRFIERTTVAIEVAADGTAAVTAEPGCRP